MKQKKPSQPRQFWSSEASVSVMALSLLLLVLFAGLLLCVLFVIRLYIVVKNGSTRVSGNKASVTLLAVVGSGNATYFTQLTCLAGIHAGLFRFLNAVPVHEFKNGFLGEMCRGSLTYCHQCCHYVSVSPAPEVGDVLPTCQGTCCCQLSFRSCAKLVVTFTLTVPQVDTQRRSYGCWSPCPRSTHLGTM